MLPQPDIAITIHGVGEHEPGQVRRELEQVWGSSCPFPVVDFNWCIQVGSKGMDTHNILAKVLSSIDIAKGYVSVQNAFLRACVDLNDFCWGFTRVATQNPPPVAT